jgi:acetyl esterase/lipase
MPASTRRLLALLAVAFAAPAFAQDKPAAAKHVTETDIPYRAGDKLTAAMKERCKLDVHYPDGAKGVPAVVWFHGGGLTAGEKAIPKALQNQNVIVIAPNYRLSPKATSPAYIEDAAAAVAWAVANADKYGGSKKKVFVSGHSAGGYLTGMVGLDKQWLKAHDVDADSLAGLVPFSGQSLTHSTIRKERGLDEKRPVLDEMAPLFHVRNDCPPLLVISGDREKELNGRYEESAYFWRMMKQAGHKDVELVELKGYDHGGMAEPGFPLLLKFVKEKAK